MGAIDPTLLKFYAAVATLGGGPDFSAEQTSGQIGNEISKITVDERTVGSIRYAKQFLRNENADAWANVNVYLTSRTQISPNTDISFALTGTKSMLETASVLSGTAVFTATGWITTSTDLTQEVNVGEMVFNSTADDISKSKRISAIGASYIQLEGGYTGTATTGTISVAPATSALFISPTYSDDPTSPTIDVPAMGVCGVWKRYQVWDGCPQFTNDWFTLTFEED